MSGLLESYFGKALKGTTLMNYPRAFHYLAEPAQRFGSRDVLWSSSAEKFIDGLSEHDLGILRDLYEEIERRGHADDIKRWLERVGRDPRRDDAEVERLFILFEWLADLGAEPFVHRLVSLFEKEAPALNWNALPEEFRFLVPHLERYGGVASEWEVRKTLAMLSDEDLSRIEELAAQIREGQKDDRLLQWAAAHEKSHPEEVECLWNLLRVVESAGFEWRSPKEMTAELLREEWRNFKWGTSSLFLLTEKSAQLLDLGEACALAREALSRIPEEDLPIEMLALGSLRSELVLDWIETNVRPPANEEWGHLAAVSRLSWSRVEKWLTRGRPLSLVALHALNACWDYESGFLEEVRPKLRNPAGVDDMRMAVERYAASDPDPDVRKLADAAIDHMDEIREK